MKADQQAGGGAEAPSEEDGAVPPETATALYEYAITAYMHLDRQVEAVEAKGRTWSTLNALAVGAGAVSLSAGLPRASLGVVPRVVLAASFVVLLVGAIGSYYQLLRLFSTRTFKAPVRPKEIMDSLKQTGAATVRASIAAQLSDACEINRDTQSRMAEQLQKAIAWSKVAALGFGVSVVIVVLSRVLGGQ